MGYYFMSCYLLQSYRLKTLQAFTVALDNTPDLNPIPEDSTYLSHRTWQILPGRIISID